jgi:serine/threonine protein kinase
MTPEPIISDKNNGVLSGPGATKLFRRRYRLLETLGVGTFSTVRAALDVATGVKWACKVVPGDASNLQERLQEVAIHHQLRHSCIVGFREAYLIENTIFIITEMLTGSDLLDTMLNRDSSFSEIELREVAFQMLNAVAYLADAGVAHRDLKLENVVLVSDATEADDNNRLRLKLIDFGLAGQLTPEQPHFTASCGSLAFVAPELLRTANNVQYGTSCDVWSIGISLYTLVVGRVPYDCSAPSTCIRSIRKGPPAFRDPAWSLLSEEAVDFVKALLTVDPQARPTARDTLNHPWLRRNTSEAHSAENDGDVRLL